MYRELGLFRCREMADDDSVGPLRAHALGPRMPRVVTEFRVFLSSPGDLQERRGAAKCRHTVQVARIVLLDESGSRTPLFSAWPDKGLAIPTAQQTLRYLRIRSL